MCRACSCVAVACCESAGSFGSLPCRDKVVLLLLLAVTGAAAWAESMSGADSPHAWMHALGVVVCVCDVVHLCPQTPP